MALPVEAPGGQLTLGAFINGQAFATMRQDVKQGRQRNVHLQGLAGVALALVVLGIVLGLLHLRRNGLPVDPPELQMAATSPCMVQAITAMRGKTITYGTLDHMQARCNR